MIDGKQLDSVMKLIDIILTKECGEPTPFVLIMVEPFANKSGEGMSLRATGNTCGDMARDMIMAAARNILEMEEREPPPPQPPETMQ